MLRASLNFFPGRDFCAESFPLFDSKSRNRQAAAASHCSGPFCFMADAFRVYARSRSSDRRFSYSRIWRPGIWPVQILPAIPSDGVLLSSLIQDLDSDIPGTGRNPAFPSADCLRHADSACIAPGGKDLGRQKGAGHSPCVRID